MRTVKQRVILLKYRGTLVMPNGIGRVESGHLVNEIIRSIAMLCDT